VTEELLRRARDLAGDDVRARATLAVAECGYASAAGAPSGRRALLALEAARAAGDPALESSALDALIAAALFAGDVVQAHRAAQQRLRGITRWRAEPAQGLELKDGLHMATLCALGAGDLAAAADAAARQQRLPFLRERRDLADDEVAAPAALAGDLATALLAGQRFLQDWTAAGRPAAAGRGLTPAAVALAHGLGGDHESRSRWLDILAQVRDVPVEEAGRGTGYGELFEALVQLDEGRPDAALAALRGADGAGLLGVVFGAWIAAVQAEAGVLAGADDTEALLTNARERSRGNPVATALTERAAALLRGDPAALRPLADTLDAAGAGYQAERTRRLAAGDPSPRAG
jgi:hypothetical protein